MTAAISDAASKKRGRPRLMGEEHAELIESLYPDLSDRQRRRLYHAAYTHNLLQWAVDNELITDDDYRWICDRIGVCVAIYRLAKSHPGQPVRAVVEWLARVRPKAKDAERNIRHGIELMSANEDIALHDDGTVTIHIET